MGLEDRLCGEDADLWELLPGLLSPLPPPPPPPVRVEKPTVVRRSFAEGEWAGEWGGLR